MGNENTTQKNNLPTTDWIHHPKIQINTTEKGLLFSRSSPDLKKDYYTALYTKPLNSVSTFKIQIEEISQSDSFVDFGIIKKSKYNEIERNFINPFDSGAISYCGYSYSGKNLGLKGKVNGNGLKRGSSFYMKYEPGVEVSFYDDERRLDLRMSMRRDYDEYFLFCVVYDKDTKFFVEKIEQLMI